MLEKIRFIMNIGLVYVGITFKIRHTHTHTSMLSMYPRKWFFTGRVVVTHAQHS